MEPETNHETKLWGELINEKYAEFLDAGNQHFNANLPISATLVGLATEAMELIYATVGLLNNIGVDGQGIFDAIHEANMNKIDSELGHVKKDYDGKILRPHGWKPADISKVIYPEEDNSE